MFYEDGKDFIKKYENHFDIVIIDCSDPMGASKDIVLKNIRMEHIEKRFKELNPDGALKYYSPGMHQASQTIPGIYGV